MDPAGRRSYFGGASEAIAARTVFLETPNTRAITLIGNPSDLRKRRISAQSSTDNTLRPPRLGWSQGQRTGGQNSDATPGSVFTRRRQGAHNRRGTVGRVAGRP